mmetsp:Transcript_5807/g.7844  ORF Transcript_5807/g.7844 Transcript_5807/m.7844 type:complete len:229 (-) Transcript_5807:384-1070(-)
MADTAPPPRTVEEIHEDFSLRRTALVAALTRDVEEFYTQCDPDKENLCLYGNSDGSWDVALPAEEVPPELPEPALGINFARDGMEKKDWLKLVAVHSDAWLLSVAFFYGAKLQKMDRERLFRMINSRPTVFETLNGAPKEQHKPAPPKKPTNTNKRPSAPSIRDTDDYEEEGQQDLPCPLCSKFYHDDEFWICCDVCVRWYHGKCVRVTPAKASQITSYKCPTCLKRR